MPMSSSREAQTMFAVNPKHIVDICYQEQENGPFPLLSVHAVARWLTNAHNGLYTQ